jgi:hypothetical protein
MLPLGDWWQGVCHAAGQDEIDLAHCNMGYARGKCPRFPQDDGPDAIRFTISRHDDTLVRIYYVAERDHHPFEQGPFEYSLSSHALADPPAQATLARQAEAYVESYLRRKKEP